MIGNFGFHYNKAWFNCTYTTKRDSTVHIQQNVIQLYIYNKTDCVEILKQQVIMELLNGKN